MSKKKTSKERLIINKARLNKDVKVVIEKINLVLDKEVKGHDKDQLAEAIDHAIPLIESAIIREIGLYKHSMKGINIADIASLSLAIQTYQGLK